MTMAADKQDKVLNFSSEREQSGACSCSAERDKNQGKNFLNVPTLRFPEFTGNWEKTKLADITKRVLRKNKGVVSERPLTISAQYGLIDQRDFFNKVVASENLEGYYLLKKGEFAYNKSYSNEYPWGAVKRLDSYDEGALSTLYICFECIGVDGDWLVHYFDSPKWNGQVSAIAVEGARNHGLLNVGIEDFFGTQHFVPNNKKEQKKIATFLNLIDERISTQIRIIEDLKSLSDVICERLYTPSEKDSWQTYKYADLFSISNERNGKLQYSNVLSASQEYGMIERNELNIDIKFEASSIINYKIVRPNQYVIHLRSFQGGFAYSDKVGVCSPAYTILVPNEKLSTAFLKYHFTSKKFIDSLRVVTYGIRDGRSISVEEFLQLKVAIPDIAHQKHIVRVMQLWEEKIRIEESYLTKLHQQKRHLLTTLFI